MHYPVKHNGINILGFLCVLFVCLLLLVFCTKTRRKGKVKGRESNMYTKVGIRSELSPFQDVAEQNFIRFQPFTVKR